MLRVAILGITGRMGRALLDCADSMPEITVVGGLLRSGRDLAATRASLPANLFLTHSIDELLARVDAVIDFSHPEVTVAAAPRCAKAGVALVSGTTGLHEHELAVLRCAAARIPVLHASNFSIGTAVLRWIAQEVAHRLAGWDVEIIEWHHRHKRDAPSGTALGLARAVASARAGQPTPFVYGRGPGDAPRQIGEIGVHALRAGGEIGRHTVLFADDEESLEFTHRVHSRRAYATGALRAARWLVRQPPGWYRLEDMLLS